VTSTTKSEKETEEKQRLKLKAEKRRQMLLSKFEQKQQNFSKNMMPDKGRSAKTSESSTPSSTAKRDIRQIRCFGLERNINEFKTGDLTRQETCILCQQEENVDEDNNSSPMIQLCYIQK